MTAEKEKRLVRVCFLLEEAELKKVKRSARKNNETVTDYFRRAVKAQRFMDNVRNGKTDLFFKTAQGELQRIIIL